MTWDAILDNWQSLTAQLCQDFPHLDAKAVERFRGDQVKLVSYLADTHHLTRSEARDTLHDWMAFVAPSADIATAA